LSRVKAQHHREIGPIFIFKSAVLNGAAKGVTEANAGISKITEDDFSDSPPGDHLIEQDIRARATNGQVSQLLPKDFMAKGERHTMSKPTNKHCVAVADVFADCLR